MTYEKRAIRFLDIWPIRHWKLKAYGILHPARSLDRELVDTARRVSEETLTRNGDRTAHYGVGFVGIHAGKTADFLFVDWWADENELHHHVYVAPPRNSMALEYKTPTGLTACTWDLVLMAHERNAWVDCILKRVAEPDIDGYLNTRLSTEV